MLNCRPFPCNSIANINNLIRIEWFEYLIFLRRALVYSSMETILYVFLRLVVHEQGVTLTYFCVRELGHVCLSIEFLQFWPSASMITDSIHVRYHHQDRLFCCLYEFCC